MSEQASVNLELSKEEAEVLLGVLAAERHNEDAEAVCESVRRRLDEQLEDLNRPM